MVLPAEALVVIGHVKTITKFRFLLDFFIVVVVSSFKTKVSSLHGFQFFSSELVPQLHISGKADAMLSSSRHVS